jgi:succinyl-CoA synthetase beta subunit
LRRRIPRLSGAQPSARSGPGRLLDELDAYALLDRLGIARPPSLALDAGASVIPSLPFPYPVAAKILSAEITHKSDAGGVALGITDSAGLAAAVDKMRAAVTAHGHRLDRVLVQPMMTGIGEALIGYRVDRDVGPLVMVAVGGIFTEIYRDRSLRVAPVDLATAREMIAEVRGFQVLAGYRGKPSGDLDALAHALVALSRLADDTSIAEAEINPLIVRPAGQGVVAVDAVVRTLL